YGYRQGGSLGRALMKQMLIWAGIGFAFGFFIGANNVAHAGGFVAGGALAFIIPDEQRGAHHTARIWNAAMIFCVVLVAGSFVMVGRHFGEHQGLPVDQRKVLTLPQRMRSGEQVRLDSRDALATKTSPQQIADSLRSAARDIMSVPQIDDRSDEIKAQYTELLTKRADAFEAAAKDKSAQTGAAKDQTALSRAVSAELESGSAAFAAYLNW